VVFVYVCSWKEHIIYDKCSISQNGVHYKRGAVETWVHTAAKSGRKSVWLYVVIESIGAESRGLDAVAFVAEQRRVVDVSVMLVTTKPCSFVIAVCLLLKLFVRGESRVLGRSKFP